MEENEDRSPAIEEVLVAPPTEASLRLQVTDLLLGATARRTKGPVDPRAERCPAKDRSGAGSLRELLLPARAPLTRR